MKLNSYISIIVFALASQNAFVFAQGDIISQVKETIKAGSAKELSKYLNQTQAEFVFRDFFKQHPPAEFTLIHQGTSKGGQIFGIGQYKSGGDTYRVYMKIKAVNNQQLVHEISFAKE